MSSDAKHNAAMEADNQPVEHFVSVFAVVGGSYVRKAQWRMRKGCAPELMEAFSPDPDLGKAKVATLTKHLHREGGE